MTWSSAPVEADSSATESSASEPSTFPDDPDVGAIGRDRIQEK